MPTSALGKTLESNSMKPHSPQSIWSLSACHRLPLALVLNFLLSLIAHGRDIGPRPFTRMDFVGHSRVFSGHAKGIPTHGVKHFKALHSAKSRENITHRIVADMAHVNPAGRIGKHLKHKAARFGAGSVGFKHAAVRPAF